jgi:predicted PhzF superfamily epimerase YddE/YHI9
MRAPIYQVDAFTGEAFRGNPAAVVILDTPLEEALMQTIAAENNLSETAFVSRGEVDYSLRWFTPTQEVDLCGHATLATAHILFESGRVTSDRVSFSTASGMLTACREGDWVSLDFPSRPPESCPIPDGLTDALGKRPLAAYASRDLLAEFSREDDVRDLAPDFGRIAALDLFAVIVTAPGREVDFVSRFFAPRAGIPEDPVTGSAHCTLTPFWAKRLGKSVLRAKQLSQRGGDLLCELRGSRVAIKGQAVTYLRGEIDIGPGGRGALR